MCLTAADYFDPDQPGPGYRDSGQNKAISRPSLAYLVNILDYLRIFEFLYQINSYFLSLPDSPVSLLLLSLSLSQG